MVNGLDIDNVHNNFRLKGIEISSAWLKQSIDYISDQGAQPFDADRLTNKIFELFLDSDIYENNDNKDVIPGNIQSLHRVHIFIDDTCVLQVDEIINIGATSQQNINDAAKNDNNNGNNDVKISGRPLLKLYLSDGKRQIVALDLCHMLVSTNGTLLVSPGSKIALRNVLVRRGALMLTPSTVQVLGGEVRRLKALSSTIETAENMSTQSTANNATAARTAPITNSTNNHINNSALTNNQPITSSTTVQPMHQQQQPRQQTAPSLSLQYSEGPSTSCRSSSSSSAHSNAYNNNSSNNFNVNPSANRSQQHQQQPFNQPYNTSSSGGAYQAGNTSDNTNITNTNLNVNPSYQHQPPSQPLALQMPVIATATTTTSAEEEEEDEEEAMMEECYNTTNNNNTASNTTTSSLFAPHFEEEDYDYLMTLEEELTSTTTNTTSKIITNNTNSSRNTMSAPSSAVSGIDTTSESTMSSFVGATAQSSAINSYSHTNTARSSFNNDTSNTNNRFSTDSTSSTTTSYLNTNFNITPRHSLLETQNSDVLRVDSYQSPHTLQLMDMHGHGGYAADTNITESNNNTAGTLHHEEEQSHLTRPTTTSSSSASSALDSSVNLSVYDSYDDTQAINQMIAMEEEEIEQVVKNVESTAEMTVTVMEIVGEMVPLTVNGQSATSASSSLRRNTLPSSSSSSSSSLQYRLVSPLILLSDLPIPRGTSSMHTAQQRRSRADNLTPNAQGYYRVRCLTKKVFKFKVNEKSLLYEIVVDLEDGQTDSVVRAKLSSDICTQFLGVTVADYSAMTACLDKKSASEAKRDLCSRFMQFAGLFWVSVDHEAVSAAEHALETPLTQSVSSTQSAIKRTKSGKTSSKAVDSTVDPVYVTVVSYAADDLSDLCSTMLDRCEQR